MRTLKALVVTSILAMPLVAAAAPPTGGDAQAKPAKTHKVKSTKKKAATTPAPTPAPAPTTPAPPATK